MKEHENQGGGSNSGEGGLDRRGDQGPGRVHITPPMIPLRLPASSDLWSMSQINCRQKTKMLSKKLSQINKMSL